MRKDWLSSTGPKAIPFIDWAVRGKRGKICEERKLGKHFWKTQRKQALEMLFSTFCVLYLNKTGKKITLTLVTPHRLFWSSGLSHHAVTSRVDNFLSHFWGKCDTREVLFFYHYKILNVYRAHLIMGRIEALGEWTKYKIVHLNTVCQMKVP